MRPHKVSEFLCPIVLFKKKPLALPICLTSDVHHFSFLKQKTAQQKARAGNYFK